MDYSSILSNASKLKKASLYKVTIAEETRELLYRINTAIESAHAAGLTTTTVKLPVNFKQIDGNVSNKELQISIYYNIVTELERNGYVPSLKITDTSTRLSICWTVRADQSALKSMHDKLMEYAA
jgi:hypothetical protein